MKKLKLLTAIVLAGALLLLPALAEGQGRSGGHHGGGSHSGGSSGWSHGGGYVGGFHGGGHYGGGYRSGPGYYYWGGHFGGYPYYRSWYWGYPYYYDFGYIPYYWQGGNYYSYPSNYYEGACQRFVPTGDYHEEVQQNPQTGLQNKVQVPNGYWETVPCR